MLCQWSEWWRAEAVVVNSPSRALIPPTGTSATDCDFESSELCAVGERRKRMKRRRRRMVAMPLV